MMPFPVFILTFALGLLQAADPQRVPREPNWSGTPQDELPKADAGTVGDAAPSTDTARLPDNDAPGEPAADTTSSAGEDAPGEPSPETRAPADPPTAGGVAPAQEPVLTQPAPSPITAPSSETASQAPPIDDPAPTRAPRRQATPLELSPARFQIDLGPTISLLAASPTSAHAFSASARFVGGGAFARATARIGATGLYLGGGLSYERVASRRYGLLASSDDFGVDTEARIDGLLVHVRAAYEVVEGFQPFVDLGVGPSWSTLRVGNGTQTVESVDVTASVAAMGGMTFTLHRRWLHRTRPSRVTFGIETALGYQHRGSTAVRGAPSEEGTITFHTVDFGSVQVRGFLWKTGLVLRFL